MTLPGINQLLAQPEQYLKGKTVGLIVNQTSLAKDNQHSIAHFKSHPSFILNALFAPEHGLYGIAQDMIEIENEIDPIICDRRNPINGISLEGNLVKEEFRSFVGQYPLPNRHGMTVGELALFFNHEIDIGCELKVVPMADWNREQWYDETGLQWVPPSPNMPTLDTAVVYPGMCLIEGTQLSEGRGTTRPFENFGAPYIDPHKLLQRIKKDIGKLPGVIFRPQFFQPMFQKHRGEVCGGIQIHVTDRNQFKPFLTTLALLRAIAELYPNDLKWRTEPYEFVSDRLAIDLLYGNTLLRETIFKDTFSLEEIENGWQEELNSFKEVRNNYLIY